jgi:hypothetical protein
MPLKRIILAFVALAALLASTLGPQLGRAEAAPAAGPAAIMTWNGIAQRTALGVAKLSTAHAMASIGFVHAAVYDAAVAIEGGYEPYQVQIAPRPGASLDAAVAAAAYHVLVHYFPAQQAALDADYSAALATIPAGPSKEDGIAIGQAAAAGIISGRQGDGLEADVGFTMPAPGPGAWQLPEGQAPMTPWAAKLRPFMLKSPSQFRPGPPLALSSRAWAEDFNEVKAIGGISSPRRTAEQTDIARFWTTNPVAQYNAAFGQLAAERSLSAMETARLFAMGNLVGTDALIACFDAKYSYLFWRPQFAIPQGASDGNQRTAADPTWKPLLGAPPHPEYPSGHGCLTGAEAEVFAAFLGTQRIEIDLVSSVPDLLQPQRHYQSVNDLTREVANARIWGGIHFRDATTKGLNTGRKVAHWTLKRYFLPAD